MIYIQAVTSPSLTILIAGFGALGTVFGTFLKEAGYTVFALTKTKYIPALKDHSVRISGIWGEHEAVLDGVYDSIVPLTGREIDLIILTVKSYDTHEAIEQVKPLVGANTLVIVAQNGYGNYETVSAVVGREHTLLARIIFGAKVTEPGRAEVTVIADANRMGQPDNAVDPEQIKCVVHAINSAGVPTEYAPDVEAILWDKILYNAALNPLGAILECTYGDLAANKETRMIMDNIISEIFLVAKAHGIALNWKSEEAYREHFYQRLVPPTAKHFPSMYYDVKAGKRIEIDALNGAIVKLAAEKGIAVPVNETIAAIIRTKEKLSQRS